MIEYMTRDMMTRPTRLDKVTIGGEWVFQRRWQEQPTKVTVVAFLPAFTRRITVLLADGETEDVKVGCLRTPWFNEPAYVEALARWAALAAPDDADQAAIDAAESIIDTLLVGTAVYVYRVTGALSIKGLPALCDQAGLPEQLLTGHPASFFESGRLHVPWELTQPIVMRLAERNSAAVTALALRDETTAAEFEALHGEYEYTRDLRNSAQQLRAWSGVPKLTVAQELAVLREQLDELRLDHLNLANIARQAIELVNRRPVNGAWVQQNVGRLEERLAAIEAVAHDR